MSLGFLKITRRARATRNHRNTSRDALLFLRVRFGFLKITRRARATRKNRNASRDAFLFLRVGRDGQEYVDLTKNRRTTRRDARRPTSRRRRVGPGALVLLARAGRAITSRPSVIIKL